MFYWITAAADGRVIISPKGLDSLRVISPTKVMWLNINNSVNETAALIRAMPGMTLMFSVFFGSALTLQPYGTAECLQPGDIGWEEALSSCPGLPASRQIFDLTIDRVQTFCGSGVPEMKIFRDRAEDELFPFFDRMPDGKLVAYQKKKNMISIDGKPSDMAGRCEDWCRCLKVHPLKHADHIHK